MDDEIRKIIEEIFSVKDAEFIQKTLEIVNKDLSVNSRAKRVPDIEFLLGKEDLDGRV